MEVVNDAGVFELRGIEITITLSTWGKGYANCLSRIGYKILVDNCRWLLYSRVISLNSKGLFQLSLFLVQQVMIIRSFSMG